MGAGMYNFYPGAHHSGGVWTFQNRIHYGNINLDSTCPTVLTRSDYNVLRGQAAVSQAAFDNAYADLSPTWYSTLTTADKAALRAGYLASPAY